MGMVLDIDLDYWNAMSLKFDYSVLVSQHHFLEYAIREVVYVQIFNHGSPNKCLPLDSMQWCRYLSTHLFNISTALTSIRHLHTLSAKT